MNRAEARALGHEPKTGPRADNGMRAPSVTPAEAWTMREPQVSRASGSPGTRRGGMPAHRRQWVTDLTVYSNSALSKLGWAKKVGSQQILKAYEMLPRRMWKLPWPDIANRIAQVIASGGPVFMWGGAMGLEFETPLIVRSAKKLPYGTVLAENPVSGLRIKIDKRTFFRDGKGNYYPTREALKASGVEQGLAVREAVAEIVSYPFGITGEPSDRRKHSRDDIIRVITDIVHSAQQKQAGKRRYGPLRRPIDDLFIEDDGWVISGDAEEVLIEFPPVFRDKNREMALFGQYTAGIPLAEMYEFLKYANKEGRTEGRITAALLEDGLDIADEITAMFADWISGDDLPGAAAEILHEVTEVAEFRGFWAIAYPQLAAAMIAHAVDKRDFLVKNYTRAAARTSLQGIRRMLTDSARRFMEEKAEEIRGRVVRKFRERITDFDSRFHKATGEVSSETVDILALQLSDTNTTISVYLDNALLENPEQIIDQARALGVFAHFLQVDTNDGRLDFPLVVIEFRAFGPHPIGISDIEDLVRRLEKRVKESYDRARRLYAQSVTEEGRKRFADLKRAVRLVGRKQRGADPVAHAFGELMVAAGNLEGHWRHDDVRTALLPVGDLAVMLLALSAVTEQGRPLRQLAGTAGLDASGGLRARLDLLRRRTRSTRIANLVQEALEKLELAFGRPAPGPADHGAAPSWGSTTSVKVLAKGSFGEDSPESVAFMRSLHGSLPRPTPVGSGVGRSDQLADAVNGAVEVARALSGQDFSPLPAAMAKSRPLLERYFDAPVRPMRDLHEIIDQLVWEGPGSHGIVIESRADGEPHAFNAIYDSELRAVVLVDVPSGRLASVSPASSYKFLLTSRPVKLELPDGVVIEFEEGADDLPSSEKEVLAELSRTAARSADTLHAEHGLGLVVTVTGFGNAPMGVAGRRELAFALGQRRADRVAALLGRAETTDSVTGGSSSAPERLDGIIFQVSSEGSGSSSLFALPDTNEGRRRVVVGFTVNIGRLLDEGPLPSTETEPPRDRIGLSHVVRRHDWPRIYIDSLDYPAAEKLDPSNPGSFYDRDLSPGFQKAMEGVYEALLDGPGIDIETLNWETYDHLHDLATKGTLGKFSRSANAWSAFPLNSSWPAADTLAETIDGWRLLVHQSEVQGRDWQKSRALTVFGMRGDNVIRIRTLYKGGDIPRLVNLMFDRFRAEMRVADTEFTKLVAISRLVRNLHIQHSFGDGNRRLNVYVLLPLLLLAYGFTPVVYGGLELPGIVRDGMGALFHGGYSLQQMATALHLSQHTLRGGRAADRPVGRVGGDRLRGALQAFFDDPREPGPAPDPHAPRPDAAQLDDVLSKAVWVESEYSWPGPDGEKACVQVALLEPGSALGGRRFRRGVWRGRRTRVGRASA